MQILKLAEEEAEVIGASTASASRRCSSPTARGSACYYERRLGEVGAWPVATDPTGSGDAFSAAYLAARSGGLSPSSAARRATALVGACCCARVS
jgi:sugar/nucleoside kinase (ribokinase family)